MGKKQKMLTTILILSLCLSMAAGYGLPAAAAGAAPPPEPEAFPTLDEIMDADTRVWHYIDDPMSLAQIQNIEWTAAGYDDSGWLTAAGSFGAYKGRLCACATICPTGMRCQPITSAWPSPPSRRS